MSYNLLLVQVRGICGTQKGISCPHMAGGV